MADKIPVLFLNSPESFGADTWLQALLMRHLDAGAFEVHAACPPGTASWEQLSRIPGLVLRPTRFGPSLKASRLSRALGVLPGAIDLLALAAYVRRRGIRIVHASDRPRDAVTCAVLAKLTKARAVIHVHVKFDAWIGGRVRWAFRKADALIAITGYVARSLADQRFSRVRTVLNAIEPRDWDPAIAPRLARGELGAPADAPLVLSVSRLFHWKGHRELLRAFALVRRELPAARLWIAGAEDALAGGPRYADELKALASKLGLSGAVLFTGRRADVDRLLAACDVFCLPSFEEPFGLVYAEAMAMQRPVVALDNGGTPEVVAHGETGLLVPPRDVEALAAALLKLLRDPKLRAAMGEAGRRRVEQRFAPQQLAEGVAAVYRSLL